MVILQLEERVILQPLANDHASIEGKRDWFQMLYSQLRALIPVLLVHSALSYRGDLDGIITLKGEIFMGVNWYLMVKSGCKDYVNNLILVLNEANIYKFPR